MIVCPLRLDSGADPLDQSGLRLSPLQRAVRPLRAHHPPHHGRGARQHVDVADLQRVARRNQLTFTTLLHQGSKCLCDLITPPPRLKP